MKLFSFPLNFGDAGRSPTKIQHNRPGQFITDTTIQCIVNAEGIANGSQYRPYTHIYVESEGVTGWSFSQVTPSDSYTRDYTASPLKVVNGKQYDLIDVRQSGNARQGNVLNFTFTGKIYRLMVLNLALDLTKHFIRIDPDFELLNRREQNIFGETQIVPPLGGKTHKQILNLTYRDALYSDTDLADRQSIKNFFLDNTYFVYTLDFGEFPDELNVGVLSAYSRRYINEWTGAGTDISFTIEEK